MAVFSLMLTMASSFVLSLPYAIVPSGDQSGGLMPAVLNDARRTEDSRLAYYNPRPSQLDPSIRTVIGLPNFPSYESGHSTFSAAAAEVLSYLFPEGASNFDAQKEEADIEAGKEHGKRIGGYTVSFARIDGADR